MEAEAFATRSLDRPSICRLNESVSRKVQVGQAISDASRVVKELIDNALDAKAQSITIVVNKQNSTIVVSDNGCGIASEDFPLVCTQATTSKLKTKDELAHGEELNDAQNLYLLDRDSAILKYDPLSHVDTLGFRGMALFAISNLAACVKIISATQATAPLAKVCTYSNTDGSLISQHSAARERGTTVEVIDLFGKWPVRRKHAEASEKKIASSVVSIVTKYALAHPEVRFSLSINSSLKLNSPGALNTRVHGKHELSPEDELFLLSNVIGAIFSPGMLKTMCSVCSDLEVDLATSGGEVGSDSFRNFHLAGWASRGDIIGSGRPSADRQFLALNGRPVEIPALTRAITDVYRQSNINNAKLFPNFVFLLKVPHQFVDSNISPDKSRVYLSVEKPLVRSICALLSGKWIVSTTNALPVSNILMRWAGQKDRYVSSRETRGEAAELEELEPVIFPESESSEDHEQDSPCQSRTQEDRERLTYDEVIRESQVLPVAKEAVHKVLERLERGNEIQLHEPGQAKALDVPSRPEVLEQVDAGSQSLHVNEESSSIRLESLLETKRLSPFDGPEELDVIGDTSRNRNRQANTMDIHQVPVHTSRVYQSKDGICEGRPTRSKPMDEGPILAPSKIVAATQPNPVPATLTRNRNSRMRQAILKEYLLPADKESPIPSLSVKRGRADHFEQVCCDDRDDDAQRTLSRPESERTPDCETRKRRGVQPADSSYKTVKAHQSMVVLDTERDCSALNNSCGTLRTSVGLIRQEYNQYAGLFDLDRETQVESGPCSTAVGESATPCLCSVNPLELMDPNKTEDAEQSLEYIFDKKSFEQVHVIAQFNRSFLIGKLDSNLLIIDPHAADEKFNFEKLNRELTEDPFGIKRQGLVVPRLLDITPDDEVLIEEHLCLLVEAGFDIRPAKQDTQSRFALHAVPHTVGFVMDVNDLLEILSYLRHHEHVKCDNGRELLVMGSSRIRAIHASRACRKSVMIGDTLDHQTMQRVVRQLANLQSPWSCPHGRPTMRHLFDFAALTDEADGLT